MGAFGQPYITREQFLSYIGQADQPALQTRFDWLIDASIKSATREVNHYTNRQFNRQEEATRRYYVAEDTDYLDVDDFWTDDGLVVETSADFDPQTVLWTSKDYKLWPYNGVHDGEPGWPQWRIERSTLGVQWFDRYGAFVTAKWGWKDVPDDVVQGTLILAAENFQLKDAKLGMAAFDQYAGAFLRVRDNKIAAARLQRYRRDPIRVG